MSVKKLIGKLHLWLGLGAGLIVFIIAITGCILAFEQEIKNATQPYLYAPTVEGAVPLPPSRLKAIAEKALPGKPATAVSYQEKGKSAAVMFYNPSPEYFYQVFLDPYTGKVLKVWNEDDDFFHFILHGHFYLWLPPAIGQPVVASATLVFVCMLISGLILWWPKNRGAARQRFSIKWNARWRRVNYDLHNVLGFYAMAIGLLLAITGLVWGFQWFSKALYFATSGGAPLVEQLPQSDTTRLPAQYAASTFPPDQVWQRLRSNTPQTASLYISIPQAKAEAITVYLNYKPGTYYKMDCYNYDQYTLKEAPASGPYVGRDADLRFADKLRRMNYDIHVGAIIGLPGKIIMFLASLIIASLPVTGFCIWWGRRNKKKPVKAGKAASVRPVATAVAR